MSAAFMVAAILCATNAAFGWLLGYHDPAAYLACWSMVALLAGTAWTVASRGWGPAPRACLIVRAAIAALGTIVLIAMALGAAGLLTLTHALVAEALAFAASRALLREAPRRAPWSPPPLPAAAIAVIGALVAFMAGYAVMHAPLTLYDSVSYHLFFPARWLQAHRLSIVPTPFSDEAQAYAPANGELYFLWLMLPFHGDLLARFGQWPFALFGATALYAIARRLRAAPGQAVIPAVFWLLSEPVMEQAVGADVDLVCTTLFVASVYLILIAVEQNRRRDWLLAGVAAGLYAGTKYLALFYLPVLLVLAAARGVRRRSVWAMPGMLLFAAPWYLRNWIEAGSPIYPVTLQIGRVVLARGAYTHAAMLDTAYHTTQLSLLPVTMARAFGPPLLLVWIPLAALGTAAMIRRGWWPDRLLLLTPVLMLPLFWFGVPMNGNGRYLMPMVPLALLPLAFAGRWSRGGNLRLGTIVAFAGAWVIMGSQAAIPAALPWYMRGWLTLHGLVAPAFLPLFAGVAGLVGFGWLVARRRPGWAIPVVALICAGSAVALAFGGEQWCVPSRCDYLQTDSPHIPIESIYAWRWVGANLRRATIAYTGDNLPYPLTGTDLTNRVVYANIDGHPRWRFDRYARAYETGRMVPIAPLLATGSGELMPVTARAAMAGGAMRPRFERLEGVRATWLDNLRVLKVTCLFVAKLLPDEAADNWHDADGFPIENTWAREEPHLFRLVFSNGAARIYAVTGYVEPPPAGIPAGQ